MADEFAKGLAVLMGGGLAWLTLAGWYRTPEFEGEGIQLVAPVETPQTIYGELGVALMDVMAWFAVIGALTFWVVIPAFDEARSVLDERRTSD